MKNKAIIYGMGQAFQSPYFQSFLLPELIMRYDIVGVCDKINNSINPTPFPYIERNADMTGYDIIVTSDMFYNEICNELTGEFGIDRERLIALSEFDQEIKRERFRCDLFQGKNGVEIGGPSWIFERNIYSVIDSCDGINFSQDTVWGHYYNKYYLSGEKYVGNMIIADAVDLSVINDDTYDFCISSNNLEHIANPIKALLEMKRITKEGGVIVIVVPVKETCFDHNRDITQFIHLVSDYKNNIDESDMTHLNEILELHDYEMDSGVSSKEEFEERSKYNYDNRCLHHHVFDEELLRLLFRYTGIEIAGAGKIYNNYYIVGNKCS